MRPESREEIVARVSREQEFLHPTPVYPRRSRARLRAYLIVIVPSASPSGGWRAPCSDGTASRASASASSWRSAASAWCC